METGKPKLENRNPKLEAGSITAAGPLQKICRVKAAIQLVWNFLRELSGENDYARYCAFALRQGDAPMTSRAFYLSQLHRKYSRPNRCC